MDSFIGTTTSLHLMATAVRKPTKSTTYGVLICSSITWFYWQARRPPRGDKRRVTFVNELNEWNE